MKRFLIVPDVHVPYQDDAAIGAVVAFKRDFKPHHVVLLGDLLSADQVSPYPGDEETTLSDEFAVANDILDRLTPHVYMEGNHEQRLSRAGLVDRRIRELLSPVAGLRLKERGVRWYPLSSIPSVSVHHLGRLRCVHGWWWGQHCAKQHAEALGCCVFGHSHRIQCMQSKFSLGPHHVAWNIGCLCRDDIPYMMQRPPSGWGKGFAFGYLHRNGMFQLYQVQLVGPTVVINGRSYPTGQPDPGIGP